ncbi:hypothetical protein E2C01_019502 [Portunus trituberculatus]|uniref:Uncharacterized protein n=1 Tax=Portunus trituberculatus TaxID=210409 RepID=A0A5B7DZ62_PORTR|nr:hypothetical protein [Portunus trituberculatus]
MTKHHTRMSSCACCGSSGGDDDSKQQTYCSVSAHVLVLLPSPAATCMSLQTGDGVHQPSVLHSLHPSSNTCLDLDGCCSLPHVVSKSDGKTQSYQ